VTISEGTQFTFRTGAQRRIGYYHLRSRQFVVLTEDSETILGGTIGQLAGGSTGAHIGAAIGATAGTTAGVLIARHPLTL
jgi:outer membrane lipoprotein SlyB